MLRSSSYYIILSILSCFISGIAFGSKAQSSQASGAALTNTGYINNASRLLDVLKWDILYEKERKKDITYLLGGIDGEDLKDLTLEQKKQVAVLVQDVAIKQMQQDRMLIREYLMNQYSQFFTVDELGKLIQYFNTKPMQSIINTRVKATEPTTIDVRKLLHDSNEEDKKIIAHMTNSYLYMRYSRFQEKISPLVQKMIVNKLKEALDLALKQTPALVKYVKNGKTT